MPLHFHKYGPVEVAITQGTHDDAPETFAKCEGVLYRELQPESGSTGWEVVEVKDVRPEAFRAGRKLGDLANREYQLFTRNLLDSAAQLCYYEYEQFQEADAQMGDPYP